MCNPGSIEESPNVQVTSLGNNSSSKSLHKTLKDSVQTHLTLNIAGGTTVYILLIIAMVVMFSIYKAQKTAHTRLHHLSKFVKFPGHDNHGEEQAETEQ